MGTDIWFSAAAVDTDNQRFKGHQSYKIDPKFRVSVPASWRPEAGAPLFLLSSKECELPVIKVLSKEAYDHKVRVINESDKTPKEKSALLGKLALFSREASINEQGKLLVPKDLSTKAEIEPESEVVLAGRGINFEIWSKPNFDKYLAILDDETSEDDLGIF